MTVIVVKKDECSTSLDRRETSHQSSRDEQRGVDWFAVAIDGEGGGLSGTLLDGWLPESSRPSGQSIGQGLSSIGLGHL